MPQIARCYCMLYKEHVIQLVSLVSLILLSSSPSVQPVQYFLKPGHVSLMSSILRNGEVAQHRNTPAKITSHKHGSFNVRFSFRLLILYYTSHSFFQIIRPSLSRFIHSSHKHPNYFLSTIYMSNKKGPQGRHRLCHIKKTETNPSSDPHTHSLSVRYTVCSGSEIPSIFLSFFVSFLFLCFFLYFQTKIKTFIISRFYHALPMMAERKKSFQHGSKCNESCRG